MKVKNNKKRVNYNHFLIAPNELMKANRKIYNDIIKEKNETQKPTKAFQIIKSILNIEYNLLKVYNSINEIEFLIHLYNSIKNDINNEKERKEIITKLIHYYLFIRFFAIKIINDSKKELSIFNTLLNEKSNINKYYILPHIKKLEYLSNILENKIKFKFKKIENSCIYIIKEEKLLRDYAEKDVILLKSIEQLLLFFKNRIKQEIFNLEEKEIKNEINKILQKLENISKYDSSEIKNEFVILTKKLNSHQKLKEMLITLYQNIISKKALIDYSKHLKSIKIEN